MHRTEQSRNSHSGTAMGHVWSFSLRSVQNVFILCNSVKQNVFIYRLTADIPNVITVVEAKFTKSNIDSHLPTAALTVHACYADGSHET